MYTKFTSTIATLLLVNTLAQAGSSPAPATAAPTGAEADTGPSFELSAGYDTNYIFRGEELFNSTVWGQADAAFSITSNTTITFMAWYADAPESDYNELDLHGDLTVDAGFAELSVGYAAYVYPRGALGGEEGISNEDEVVFSIAKSLGKIDLGLLAAYNMDREGTYYELTVGTSFELTEMVSLEPSVVVGYSSDYFANDGFSHALLSLAAPIALTDSWTLKPYIAGNLPLEALEENQDAKLFGGVVVAYSF